MQFLLSLFIKLSQKRYFSLKKETGGTKEMWILYAIGSSFFAGITAVLAKCGIQKTNSNVATAIRTIVVLLFSWLMVFLTGAQTGLTQISSKTLLFLVLSGLATGASWLCYFHALQHGDINKVVPIDKSGTILTILLALIFLKEGVTGQKLFCVLLIAAGTFLMITRKDTTKEVQKSGSHWMFFAILSAIFTSLTAILGKVGIEGVDSNLGTAIRTTVVLLMVFATGLSWLCYYKALQDGQASVVVPIDKLSILITIAFSRIVWKERLTKKAMLGLLLLTVGNVFMA